MMEFGALVTFVAVFALHAATCGAQRHVPSTLYEVLENSASLIDIS